MTDLYLDLEVFSAVDLKTAGVYPYAAHPSTETLMCAWATDDEPAQLAVGREQVTAIPGLFNPRIQHKAWNANYERVVLSAFKGLPRWTYLSPNNWWDPAVASAENGGSQKLEIAARKLGVEEKADGGALIKLFCMLNRGKRVMPADRPMDWIDFCLYCLQDVEALRALDRVTPSLTAMERQVWLADQTINDRGVKIDLEMARAAVGCAARNTERDRAVITGLSGIHNPNSVQQVKEWLDTTGLALPNLRAETVTAALRGTVATPVQRQVLELRQELALASHKKFNAALAQVCDDGRIRGQFRFFGAHTGRWAGKGVQLQNLPRDHMDSFEQEQEALLDLLTGNDLPSSDLKKIIRPMLVGPFTIVDFSAIEARVIAWLANEKWALDAFRAGRDIYVETAKRMGNLGRAQGKVAVLALGFGGGNQSLLNMAGLKVYDVEGDRKQAKYEAVSGAGEKFLAWAKSTDKSPWNAAGFLVGQWRTANPNIVQFWKDLENACAKGGTVGRIRVERKGATMRIYLPSGRALVYHGLKYENYSVKRTEEVNGQIREWYEKKTNWRYDNPGGFGRIMTYGGRLCENVVQAVARDLLGEAMVRLEDRGYQVEVHVHDEVAVRGVHDVALINKIMCESPIWSHGLPLGGAGFVSDRYRKEWD